MKNLNDETLLFNTKQLVQKERRTLKEILEHLQEIYNRKLFADLGYSSLFKYLVKELKYSEGAASRRVSALKLVQKIPETKKLIESGELNLTVASRTQNCTENKNINETLKILKQVSGKTKDEAEKVLLAMTCGDATVKADRTKRISENEVRIQLTITDETRTKLKLVKDYFKCSSDEALNMALDKLLKDREEKLVKKSISLKTKGRTIPWAIKKAVMNRAKSRCEFPGCGETGNLEFEHIHPYAKGETIASLI